jgi:hypothetical protein
MTWLVWRQHRHQAYFAAAALAAFAVLLLVTGLQMASQYHSALASCAASNTCGNLASTLSLGVPVLFSLVTLTLVVPCLLGVFWGGPLIARELETGTSQFAWMQSVTRRHWLTVKTGWILLAAAAWGGAVSALVTWWSGPENALHHQKFDLGKFDIQGIVPIGYAMFAVALGIAAGTLVRRTLPALAITLGVFTGLRLVIANYLRPHYLTAISTTFNVLHPVTPSGSYWRLAMGVIAPGGQAYTSGALTISGVPIIPSACLRHLSPGPRGVMSCVNAHGYRGFITYQPASHYWAFQGIETGIFVLFAAALIAVTAIVIIRRDA